MNEQRLAEGTSCSVGSSESSTELGTLNFLYSVYSAQQDLYQVFMDLKKAFDRVWHAALWATMKKYNISTNLIRVIKNLYDKATSAVLFNSSIGDLVPNNSSLTHPLQHISGKDHDRALKDHEGTVSIGVRAIASLCFADDIDGLVGPNTDHYVDSNFSYESETCITRMPITKKCHHACNFQLAFFLNKTKRINIFLQCSLQY